MYYLRWDIGGSLIWQFYFILVTVISLPISHLVGVTCTLLLLLLLLLIVECWTQGVSY